MAVRNPNYNVLGSYDKDKLSMEKLQKILLDVIKNPENTVKLQKSREFDISDLDKKLEKFCEDLEKKVVNDIDAQVIS